MIPTGGSRINSPPVGILRSNLTGAGNAITEPVVKWVEGVIEVRRKPTADTLQLPPGFVRAQGL